MTTNISLIFERWKASLASRDRTKNAVAGNFDELFEDLKRDGASFDDAHSILPLAIKAHLPSSSIVRNTYNHIKKHSDKTLQEFTEEWNKSIADKATESFFAFFEIKKSDDEEDNAPKVHGNMSSREYALQRRYVETIPKLDTSALEARLRTGVYNLSEEELLKVLGNKNGQTN